MVRSTLLVACVVCAVACVGRPRADHVAPALPVRALDASFDTALMTYTRHGLYVVDRPRRIVGQVAFLAGATNDSTVVLVSVWIDDPSAAAPVVALNSRPLVAGAITRTESVSTLSATASFAPGPYTLSFAGGQWPVRVPRLTSGSLSSPIAVYEATPRTSLDSAVRLTVRPRATATIGRDTAIAVYVESYAAKDVSALPVTLSLGSDSIGSVYWHAAATLDRHATVFGSVITIPVRQLGLGEVTLTVASAEDTVRTPLFVGFGEQVPAVSFGQLLGVLRYFTSPLRVDSLRHAPPDQRASAWSAFLSHSNEHSSEHPSEHPSEHSNGPARLDEYLARVHDADERWSDVERPGWATDRGRAYLLVGDPEQVFMRGREAEIWVYTRYFTRLVFAVDPATGRRTLTDESQNDLTALNRRVRAMR